MRKFELYKIKAFIILPLALYSLPIDASVQATSNTNISDDEKCRFLNDSLDWQQLCEVSLVVERAMDEAESAALTAEISVDPLETMLRNKDAWRSTDLFNSLDDNEKSIPLLFTISSASVAFYEFACETKQFEKFGATIDILIGSLVSEPARQKLKEEYYTDLNRRGYGNRLIMQQPFRECDYDRFYDLKIQHLKDTEKVNNLISR